MDRGTRRSRVDGYPAEEGPRNKRDPNSAYGLDTVFLTSQGSSDSTGRLPVKLVPLDRSAPSALELTQLKRAPTPSLTEAMVKTMAPPGHRTKAYGDELPTRENTRSQSQTPLRASQRLHTRLEDPKAERGAAWATPMLRLKEIKPKLSLALVIGEGKTHTTTAPLSQTVPSN